MALDWFFRPLRNRSAAYNGRAGAYPPPQELRMRPPPPDPHDYAPRATHRGQHEEPHVVVHREDLPDPKLTMADYEAAARQIEEAADRTLAFNKQVHAYCYEISAQMRVKGANVAEELMRARRMAEKVAQGTEALVKFCLDHDRAGREELAGSLNNAAPQDIPVEPSTEPTSSPDEKGASEGGPSNPSQQS